MRKRRYTDEQFADAIKQNYSVRGVLKTLGLAPAGGSYKLFHSRVKELNIDTSHFTGQAYLSGKKHNWSPKKELSEILIEDSDYNTNHLKNRLVKEGVLINKCSNLECGLNSWLGQKIVLELDHINGNNRDHRLSNLRLLCPNCHSLTETFRNKKRK